MFDIGTMAIQNSSTKGADRRNSRRISTPLAARAEAVAGRSLDILVAASALVFLAPVFVFVMLLIKFGDFGPIFFGHRRIGKGGRHFKCLKFRTMVPDAEERLRILLEQDPVAQAEWEADHKLRNDPRISPLGAFLRKTSLDELPQLVNVLRGEMSIVGPRPIVDGEVCRYGHYFENYCGIRPGITGLWQVSGRNDVSYRRRVALDVYYSGNKSVLLDLKIMLMTIPAVLHRRGSY